MVSRGLRFLSLSIVAAFIAALLFSVSLDTNFSDLRQLYADEQSQFLDLPSGTQAHIRDEGNPDGPVIILLHGSNSSLHTWERWVDLLGDRYRMISIDLPGHGLTGRTVENRYTRADMVRFVAGVANALHISEFALAGNSMGGGVAWAFARRYPNHVTHLILLAPSGIGRVPQETPMAFRLAENPMTRPMLRWLAPRRLIANGLYTSFVDDNFVSEDLIDRYWQLNRMTGNRLSTLSRFSLPSPPDLKQFEGAIQVPSLIIWGEDDQILPYDRDRVMWDVRTKFAGGLEENAIVTFADTGHLPQVERATESAAVAAHFLAQ